MSHVSIRQRYVRRSCRWTNDREFCAWIERRHFRIVGAGLGALLALDAGIALASLLAP